MDRNLDIDCRNTEVGRELWRLDRLYALPPQVKSAAAADLATHDATALHTPAATIFSAYRLFDKRAGAADTGDPVVVKLYEAADYWGMRSEVDAALAQVKAAAADDLAALPDEAFLHVKAGERRCPVRNAAEAEAAGAYLLRHRDAFLFADRVKMARHLLERADALGAAVDDGVARLACYGACAPAVPGRLFRQRAEKLARSRPEKSAELRAVADALDAQGTTWLGDPLRKVAGALDEVDRAAGLDARYGVDIDRPEDVLCAVTCKVASAWRDDHVVLITGTAYKAADLAAIDAEAVRGEFGDELATALTDGIGIDAAKAAAELPILPRPDAAHFDRFAAARGIKAAAYLRAPRRDRTAAKAVLAALMTVD